MISASGEGGSVIRGIELGAEDYLQKPFDFFFFKQKTAYEMPIVIGDRERMYRLGHELRRRGLWVAPVDYPAVPQNRICFRACVTAKHTRADLDEALNILEDTLLPAVLQGA